MTRSTLKADLLLFLAAAIWGAAFVAQRVAMYHVGPLFFNGLRFALGALLLLPVVAARSANRVRSDPARPSPGAGLYLYGGIAAGLILFAGSTLQQCGMVDNTAGKGGFITSLYVVLVPVFGLLIGQRTTSAAWAGVVLSVTGLYFLTVTASLDIARSDLLVLACAAVWAIHVLMIGWLAPQADPYRLAVIQCAVTAIVSFAAAMIWERPTFAGTRAALWPILYCGVISVGIAYTLQVIGQRDAPPTHAAILFGLEAVFAALTGWLLLDEQLSRQQLLGCGLMLAGVLVSQIRMPAPKPRPLPPVPQGTQP